jgi:hypothetical protein
LCMPLHCPIKGAYCGQVVETKSIKEYLSDC